eukprot:scaffold484889_cov45-Prasinocladus_malaysianus.AAC.1
MMRFLAVLLVAFVGCAASRSSRRPSRADKSLLGDFNCEQVVLMKSFRTGSTALSASLFRVALAYGKR